MIADNLESILSGGEAPLEAAVCTQLWNVLLELTKLGAGVLLTTRDTNFGDGRLSPGKQVAHLALGGLYAEDAYALASRLLVDLQIDRARAPYTELRDLLKQLDHHPLAIQLALPALRTMPLATVRDDFASLLPKFVDDTVTGRNRSLLASLEYSLQRLSEEQWAYLPRLALFEGGASEGVLLAITEIPESEWVKLRLALEQAALLTAEHVHDAIAVPFLRFHPVLAPFLRSQPGAGDAALRERYIQGYYGVAGYLYLEDDRNPGPVRALVRRELPNLRRALYLLLEVGDIEAASLVADRIIRFLNYFGQWRQRDEIRRRVGDAMSAASTKSGTLTRAEWLQEFGMGQDEYRSGNLRSASIRFANILQAIKALPKGMPLGHGSYEHSLILFWLARCLFEAGQATSANSQLQEALIIINTLIQKQPEDRIYVRQRGLVMGELGNVLFKQGKYRQAQEAYEDGLQVAEQQSDLRQQAVAKGQLGLIALIQHDYVRAKSRFTAALEIFHVMGELTMEAAIWHNLGAVAEEQKEWEEAEHCYRESLVLEERLGDARAASKTCNQLGLIARASDHPLEAEGWYHRALELYKQRS